MTGTMTAEFGSAPSGPPLQSMGGRDRSVWTTDGYWYPWRHPFPNVAYHCYFTSPAGGHTDAYRVARRRGWQ